MKRNKVLKKWLMTSGLACTSAAIIFGTVPLFIQNQKAISDKNDNQQLANEQENQNINLQETKAAKKQQTAILNTISSEVDYKKNQLYAPFDYRPISAKPWKRLVGQKGVLNIQETSSSSDGNKIKLLYTPLGYSTSVDSAFLYGPVVSIYDFTDDINRFSDILGTADQYHEINFCGGLYNESLGKYVTVFTIRSNVYANRYYYFPYIIDDEPFVYTDQYQPDIYYASIVHSLNKVLQYRWNNQTYDMYVDNPSTNPNDNNALVNIHKDIKLVPYYEYNPDYHPGDPNYNLNDPNAPQAQNRPYESFLMIPANGDYTVSLQNLFNHSDDSQSSVEQAKKITSFNIEKKSGVASEGSGYSDNGYYFYQPEALMDNFSSMNIGNANDAIIALRPMYLSEPSNPSDYTAQIALINGYESSNDNLNRGLYYKWTSSNANSFLYDNQIGGITQWYDENHKYYDERFPIFMYGKYGNSLTNSYYIDLFNSYKNSDSMYDFTLMSSFYFFPWNGLGVNGAWLNESIFVNVPLAINKDSNNVYTIANVKPYEYSYFTQSDYDVDWENVFFDYLNNCLYAYQTYTATTTGTGIQRYFTVKVDWNFFMNFNMPNNVENTNVKDNGPGTGVDYFKNNMECGIVNEKPPFAESNGNDNYRDYANLPIPIGINLIDNQGNKHKTFIYYFSYQNGAQQSLLLGRSNATLLKEDINDWGIAPDKSIRAITGEYLEKVFYENDNFNTYFRTYNNYVGYDKNKPNECFIQYPYNQHVTFEVDSNVTGDETSKYILRFKMKMKTDSNPIKEPIPGAVTNPTPPENEFPILSNDFSAITAKDLAPKPLYILNSKTGNEFFEIRGFQYETSGETRVNQSGVYIGDENNFQNYYPSEFIKLGSTKTYVLLEELFIRRMKNLNHPIISSIGAIIDNHPNDWINFLDLQADDFNGYLYVRFELPYTIDAHNNITNNSLVDTIVLYGFKSTNITNAYNKWNANMTTSYNNSDDGISIYSTSNGMYSIPQTTWNNSKPFKNSNKNGNNTYVKEDGNDQRHLQLLSQYYYEPMGYRVALMYDDFRPQDLILRFYNDKNINNATNKLLDFNDYVKELYFEIPPSSQISNNIDDTYETAGNKTFMNRMIPVKNGNNEFIVYSQAALRLYKNDGSSYQVDNLNNNFYYINLNNVTNWDDQHKSEEIKLDNGSNIIKLITPDKNNQNLFNTYNNFTNKSTNLSLSAVKDHNKIYLTSLNLFDNNVINNETKSYSYNLGSIEYDINQNKVLNISNNPYVINNNQNTSSGSISINKMLGDLTLYQYPAMFLSDLANDNNKNVLSLLLPIAIESSDNKNSIFHINRAILSNVNNSLQITNVNNSQNDGSIGFTINGETSNINNLNVVYDKNNPNSSSDNFTISNMNINQNADTMNFVLSNPQKKLTVDVSISDINDLNKNNIKYLNPNVESTNNFIANDNFSNQKYNNYYDIDGNYQFLESNTFINQNKILFDKSVDYGTNGGKPNNFSYFDFFTLKDDSEKDNYLKNWLSHISITSSSNQKSSFNIINALEMGNLNWASVPSNILNDYTFSNFGFNQKNILSTTLTFNQMFNTNEDIAPTSFDILIKTNDPNLNKSTSISFNGNNPFENLNQTQVIDKLNNMNNSDLVKMLVVNNPVNNDTDWNNMIDLNKKVSYNYTLNSNSVTITINLIFKKAFVANQVVENAPISLTFNCNKAVIPVQENVNNPFDCYINDNRLAPYSVSTFKNWYFQNLNTSNLDELKQDIIDSLKENYNIIINNKDDIFLKSSLKTDPLNGIVYIDFGINNPMLQYYSDRVFVLKLEGFARQNVTAIVIKSNYKTDILPSSIQRYFDEDDQKYLSERCNEFVNIINPSNNTQFVSAVVNSYNDQDGVATITFSVDNFIKENGSVSTGNEILSQTLIFSNLIGNSDVKTSIKKTIDISSNGQFKNNYAQQICENETYINSILTSNIMFLPDNTKIEIVNKAYDNKEGTVNLSFRLDKYTSISGDVKTTPIILSTKIIGINPVKGLTQISINQSLIDFDVLMNEINKKHNYNYLLDYMTITNKVTTNPVIKVANVNEDNNGTYYINYEIDYYFGQMNSYDDYQIYQNGQFTVQVNSKSKTITVSNISWLNNNSNVIDQNINNPINNNQNNFDYKAIIIFTLTGFITIGLVLLIIYLIYRSNKNKNK